MKKVVILIGAPGSGKGTYAGIINEIFGLLHISTGDLLRDEIKKESEIGLKVKDLLADGKLVSDEIVEGLLNKKIESKECENGFILDGYPRTKSQAENLEKLFKDNNIEDCSIIYLQVSNEILVKRLTGRYMCTKCRAIYNEYFSPTKEEGICDKCGSKDFMKRDDDKLEVVSKRLEIFDKQIIPILDFYKNKILKLDGTMKLDKLKEELVKILK